MTNAALHRAVELVGGQSRLAELIGTTQSHVWYWLTRAKRGVPGEFVLRIEEVTGGRVSRHDLRPDIYPHRSAGKHNSPSIEPVSGNVPEVLP
ncbi:helix-turn-helix domain-containing protein [Rhodoligotrophos ferricapiens]|uniref:helix-turn-helix domain-containing protein n=1 Tax=Rhodoligotrophos ferricapiens TaxID=3069264 RepID=UPI00315CE09D